MLQKEGIGEVGAAEARQHGAEQRRAQEAGRERIAARLDQERETVHHAGNGPGVVDPEVDHAPRLFSVLREGIASGEFREFDLDAACILFNGAIHDLCMISDFQDQFVDPVPVIQLFLRSLQKQ